MNRIDITVLLSEGEIADALAAALARRELPESASYWSPLSVRAWLDLCKDGAYRNFIRSHALIEAHAAEIAAAMAPGAGAAGAAAGRSTARPARPAHLSRLDVVSLGSGQGDKDLLVLEALRGAGRDPTYRPIDASVSLLEIACARALDAGFPCAGVKGDFARDEHLAALDALRSERPALWLLVGNTLGAFDPLALARALRARVRAGDALLLDAEVYDPAATIAGYDNPDNRRFAFAPLASLGIRPEDGALSFEPLEDAALPGFFRLVKRFEPARDLRLAVGGAEILLRAGERLHMGHSGKFSEEGFRAILARAGFAPRASWRSADARFVMALVA